MEGRSGNVALTQVVQVRVERRRATVSSAKSTRHAKARGKAEDMYTWREAVLLEAPGKPSIIPSRASLRAVAVRGRSS